MAIAFVNSSSQRTTGTAVTFTAYNLSTSDFVILFVTAYLTNTDVFTSATVGGSGMTRIAGASGLDSNNSYTAAYYITGKSGSQNIVTNISSSQDTFQVVMTYSGTLQTASVIQTSNRTSATTGTSLAAAITATATANCWAVSNATTYGESLTGYTVGTIREATTVYFKGADSNGVITPSTSYTATWSEAGSTAQAVGVVEIAPAVASTANGNFLAFM